MICVVMVLFSCQCNGVSCCDYVSILTHWGWVTHICVGKLTIIGSDNGLLPGRRHAIIWNNAGVLLTEPLGTNFSEISIGIQIFPFKKMHLNMSSAKWRPCCLGLNVSRENEHVIWRTDWVITSPLHIEKIDQTWSCGKLYSSPILRDP